MPKITYVRPLNTCRHTTLVCDDHEKVRFSCKEACVTWSTHGWRRRSTPVYVWDSYWCVLFQIGCYAHLVTHTQTTVKLSVCVVIWQVEVVLCSFLPPTRSPLLPPPRARLCVFVERMVCLAAASLVSHYGGKTKFTFIFSIEASWQTPPEFDLCKKSVPRERREHVHPSFSPATGCRALILRLCMEERNGF